MDTISPAPTLKSRPAKRVVRTPSSVSNPWLSPATVKRAPGLGSSPEAAAVKPGEIIAFDVFIGMYGKWRKRQRIAAPHRDPHGRLLNRAEHAVRRSVVHNAQCAKKNRVATSPKK
ncbi:hypothetical protein PQR71_16670 [Paraburkholderia fungorum]|uniref:hypothetical protein n=1 Tax=Paraburkholderia fungorum TaxID=134537 RepID=UPI0038BA2E86